MRIQLISGPRNISTALMYSFGQRSDTTPVDEPFYGYYLKHSGQNHPGAQEVMDCMLTEAADVIEKTIFKTYETPHVFFKNMAHHIRNTEVGFMNLCTNIFLIRSPDRLIASFAKVIPHPTMNDIGLADSVALFHKINSKSVHTPLVVNSADLLVNPSAYLNTLCGAIGIPFDTAMLSWPMGPKPYDGVWAKYWYQSVHQSCGFQAAENKPVELKPNLNALYEEALTYYNFLNQFAIKI